MRNTLQLLYCIIYLLEMPFHLLYALQVNSVPTGQDTHVFCCIKKILHIEMERLSTNPLFATF